MSEPGLIFPSFHQVNSCERISTIYIHNPTSSQIWLGQEILINHPYEGHGDKMTRCEKKLRLGKEGLMNKIFTPLSAPSLHLLFGFILHFMNLSKKERETLIS